MEIDSSALTDTFGPLAKALTEDAMDEWFTTSQDILYEADSEEDDSNLFPIAQSASEPKWNEREQAWTFTYTHLATIFHEYGAEPHIIRAREAEFLAFEWPDAPKEVQEMFRETFPLVFFKEVEHPGVPERRFIRGGRDAAVRHIEGAYS